MAPNNCIFVSTGGYSQQGCGFVCVQYVLSVQICMPAHVFVIQCVCPCQCVCVCLFCEVAISPGLGQQRQYC